MAQPPVTRPPRPLAAPPVEAARVEVPELPVLKLDPQRSRPQSAAKIERLVIVAIDAGHGGEDPGARGRGGTHEKDVTLAIAKRLKARIDQEPEHARGAGARRRLLHPARATRVARRGACRPTSSSRSTPTRG